jgi:hypothetical protein
MTQIELDVVAEIIQDELNRHNSLAHNVAQRLGRTQLQRLLNKILDKRDTNE